jgi:putative hydrolase of the HAD superfamily
MIEAVLFDLDDTLTDRAATLQQYAHEFAAEFGTLLPAVGTLEIEAVCVELDERGYRPRKDLFYGILERLPWVSRPDVSVIEGHWRRWFPSLTVPQAGLRSTLSSLRTAGLRLGLVTNGSVLTQSAKITHLGLTDYFHRVIISEAVGYKKPQAEIFHKALAEVSTAPARTVFVGDHPVNDVIGARNAGLVSVWFEGIHAWPADQPPPRHRIRRLCEVEDVIRTLEI